MSRTLTDGFRTIELSDADEAELAEMAAERERERLLLADKHSPWNLPPRPWEDVPERVTLFLPIREGRQQPDGDGDPLLASERTGEVTGYQPVEMRLLGEGGLIHNAYAWAQDVHGSRRRTSQQVLGQFTAALGLLFRTPPDPGMRQHRERLAKQRAQVGWEALEYVEPSCNWGTYQFLLERLRDAVVPERVVLRS